MTARPVTYGQIQRAAAVLAREAASRLDQHGHITTAGWEEAEAATRRAFTGATPTGDDDREFDALADEWAARSVPEAAAQADPHDGEDAAYAAYAAASGIRAPASLRRLVMPVYGG